MPHLPSLDLRLRAADPVLGDARLADFHSGARRGDPDASDPLVWLLPPEPSVQTGGWCARERVAGLPMPGVAPALDPSSWSLSPRRSSRLALVAAAPLALSPAFVHAAPPAASVDSADRIALSGEEPAPPAEAAPATAPAPSPIHAAPLPQLGWEGDAIWEALEGARVEITLSDGLKASGRLLTQAAEEVAMVQDNGNVLVLPKHLVLGIRVLASAEELALQRAKELKSLTEPTPEEDREPRSGLPTAIVGTSLTGTGAFLLSALGVAQAIDSSAVYYGAPVLFIGPGLLGPGIPLMVGGFVAEGKRKAWLLEKELSVAALPNEQGGWTGNVSFRW